MSDLSGAKCLRYAPDGDLCRAWVAYGTICVEEHITTEEAEVRRSRAAMNEGLAVRSKDRTNRDLTLEQRMDQLESALLILNKTVEGIQNLFIRAGEYKGKPRGRLPE